jgi:hypothetical protein
MQELCPTQGEGPPVPLQELTPTGAALAQPEFAGEVSDEDVGVDIAAEMEAATPSREND